MKLIRIISNQRLDCAELAQWAWDVRLLSIDLVLENLQFVLKHRLLLLLLPYFDLVSEYLSQLIENKLCFFCWLAFATFVFGDTVEELLEEMISLAPILARQLVWKVSFDKLRACLLIDWPLSIPRRRYALIKWLNCLAASLWGWKSLLWVTPLKVHEPAHVALITVRLIEPDPLLFELIVWAWIEL